MSGLVGLWSILKCITIKMVDERELIERTIHECSSPKLEYYYWSESVALGLQFLYICVV